MSFKIIGVSNFDDPAIDDILIAENMTESWAAFFLARINEKWTGNFNVYHYRIVPQEEKLYEYDPNN